MSAVRPFPDFPEAGCARCSGPNYREPLCERCEALVEAEEAQAAADAPVIERAHRQHHVVSDSGRPA